MNRFSEQLLEAFEVAMDEKISNLQFDKTIQATVQSVEDLDTGEYRVKYKDGIISAFAADPKETFKQGDAVYVTVPEGDFSNKKFISHRITNNSLSTGQYTELANTIFEVSPNFSDLGYTYTSQPSNGYSLIVGRNSSVNILQSAPALANSRFKAYADQYEYIQISASFYNEFTADHEVGDYGIELVLTNLDDKQVSYFLNLNDFNGDPYHLATWSPQSAVVKIPKGQIKALNAIYFYENGFVSEGNKANLFMSDFSLNFVDKVDLTEIPYYLNILPLDGIAFTTSQTSLRLEGHIYHIGEELPESSCLFQWFERDLSVTPGDEAYDKRAGWGWRPIEGATSKLLTRTKAQVPWQKNYKLVAVYNSTTLMTKEITLINGSLDIEIEQVTSGNAIYLKLTKSGYTGDWYYLASDGNQVAIPQSPRSGTSPDIVPYLLYSPMTFYCQVYQGSVYQGELNYVMQNIESKDDVSVVFSGETLFSYDANGDINIYDAELERSLQAEIVWKKGIISSSPTIRWLDFENNVIGSSWVDYSNKDSMLKKVRVDTTENILYYTVKHKFKQTPSKNNSFRIEISTTDGQVYSFDKEIVFTKTGDPGTNGTRYQSLITVTSSNKFVGVNSSNTAVTLGCKVYKDQTEFSGANITWTPVNLVVVSQSGAAISVKANNSNRKRYVKATINITDEGKTTTLYDFFPVDSCASQPVIDISELPKYVQYAANGRNPQFRKQVPTIKYNGATATIASGDTAVIKIANGQFKPIDEFNPDNPIGLLTVTASGITIYHPVPTYINTFGNEAINGWDGVSVDVDTAGGKILAPQVGAGTKDGANKFTGVVMGKDSAQQKVGLYGYQAGVNSFGLTEEGIAYFGVAGKGRITIDGTQATIQGGGGGSSATGMTITLSAAASSADAIRVGNGNFIVTYGGKLTAKSAVVDGTITAGAGSVIGGWTLAAKRLYSGSGATYVALDSGTDGVSQAIWAGKADPASAPFRVTRAGALTATSADITGAIKATSGYIGGTSSGWKIESNRISNTSSNKYTEFATNGSYAIVAGATIEDNGTIDKDTAPFSVTQQGKLTATGAEISGKVIIGKNSKIGKLDVTDSGITDGTTSFTDSGITSKTIKLNNGSLTISDGSNNVDIKFDSSGLSTNGMTLSKGILNGGTISQGQSFSIVGGLLTSSTLKLQNGELVTSTGNNKITLKNGELFTAPDGSTVQVKITGTGLTAKQYANNGQSYIQLDDGTGITIYNVNTSNNQQEKVFYADTNGNLNLTGYITALGATLGNWKINEKQNYRLESTISAGFYVAGSSQQIASSDRTIYLDGNPLSTNNKVLLMENNTRTTSDDMTISNTKGQFFVTKDGHMQADGAVIKGEITSNAGTIANWTIVKNKIYSSNVTLYSGSRSTSDTTYNYGTGTDVYRFWAGSANNNPSAAKFFVTNAGVMLASNAIVTGTINAKAGYIGRTFNSDGSIANDGWTITETKFYGNRKLIENNQEVTRYVVLSTGSDYAFYAGGTQINSASGASFWVKYNGAFKAVSGQIGNWKINSENDGALRSTLTDTNASTRIYINCKPSSGGNVIEIRTSGQLPSGDDEDKTATNGRFYVTDQGKLFAQSAEIKGTITSKAGSIGAWTITNKAISTLTNETTITNNNTTGMARNGFTGYIGSVTGEQISNIAFWAGMKYQKNGNDYYLLGSSSGTFFAVTHSGKLYCRSADITGSVDASSFKINGTTVLSGNKIAGNAVDSTTLTVDAARITGQLTANQINATNLRVAAANITGQLVASQINATNLHVSAANIDGTLVIGQLPNTVAETSDIPTKVSQLSNDKGYKDATGVTSIINGTVTTDFVNALRITAYSVAAENITGTMIRGKKYASSTGDNYIEVSGSGLADFSLYHNNGSSEDKIFSIQDEMFGVISLNAGDPHRTFLTSSGTTTYPYGTWNFHNASVTDLTATAVFG